MRSITPQHRLVCRVPDGDVRCGFAERGERAKAVHASHGVGRESASRVSGARRQVRLLAPRRVGLVGNALFGSHRAADGGTGFTTGGWISSIIGAIIVLWAYLALAGRRRSVV